MRRHGRAPPGAGQHWRRLRRFSDNVEGELEHPIRKADGCLYQAKAEGRNRVISKPCPN